VKTAGKISLAVGCVLLAIILLHYSILSLRSFSDFGPYYRSGQRFLLGENLYNFSDGHYLFKYSPCAALFFAPVSLLPYSIASALWLCLSWILFALSYLLTKKLEMGRISLPLWGTILIFLGISKFALAEIHLGQVDFLLLCLVLLSILSLGKSREGLGGVFLAAAVLFKPPLLLILALPLWRRRSKFLLGFSLGLSAGLLAPFLRYGLNGAWELYRGWWTVITVSSPDLLASEVNQSAFGALSRWLVMNPKGDSLFAFSPGIPLIIGGILFVIFILYLWHQERKIPANSASLSGDGLPTSPAPALIILGSVVFSPLGWVQNFVFALPALYRATTGIVRERLFNLWRNVFLALFFLLAVLPNFEFLGRELYDLYLGQSWMFLGILFLALATALPLRCRDGSH